jgi:vancomycin resistance protein VanJ
MTAHAIRTFLGQVLTAAIASIATLELGLILFRPETGPIGVLEIFAPHLALLGLGLVVVGLVGLHRTRAVAATVLLVVVAARFGGDWISLPAAAAGNGASPLRVVTWNIEVDSRPAATTVAILQDVGADVIALEELQPNVARAIEADPVLVARYPYRALRARENVLGLGILSRYPLDDVTVRSSPAVESAIVTVAGVRVRLLVAHPLHAEIATVSRFRLPIGLDLEQRDADLVTIRSAVDGAIAGGEPVILLGDLNTAATEPAFDRLTSGLVDVHAAVGEGPGWTWRPIRLEFLGIGLIRIDHVITSPDVQPLAISEQCPAIGDHCLVHAEVAIPPTSSSTSR